MKRIISILTILSLICLLCGCNQSVDQENWEVSPDTTIDKNLDNESVKGAKIPIDYISKDQSSGQTITRYHCPDFSKLPLYEIKDSGSVLAPPGTFGKLMDRVDEGIIVTGYATGERTSNVDTIKTYTNFKIEKVCYGSVVSESITVQEQYALVTDEDGSSYVRERETRYTLLENDQKVLLFLTPSKNGDGTYVPRYYDLPLPEDYLEYNEEYLTEMLDFYRGDRSAYQYPEFIEKIHEELLPNGTIKQTIESWGGDYWPERDVSNEVLLEELNENALVRSAVEFEIKIWPFEHREYGANNLPIYGNDALLKDSLYENKLYQYQFE